MIVATLRNSFRRDETGNSVPEDTPTALPFSAEAVILLKKPSYKEMPNGYIYKTVIRYEASTIENAQRILATQNNAKCDLWIDRDGACRMLVLTDMRE